MSAARVLLTIAFGALTAYAFTPVFGGPLPNAFVAALGVAALASVLATRLPPVSVTLVAAAAVVASACLTAGAGVDVLSGPWQLLSGAVPAESSGPGLAAAAILSGWATLAGGVLAGQARNPLLPLAPPAVCLGTALSLGASAGPLPGWYAPAAVALVGLLLLASRPAFALRRFVPITCAALVTGLAALAAATLGPTAPGLGGREPADLRALVAAPVQPRSGVSPLQQYLALRDGTQLLHVTGTASRTGTALRMATLTAFDGTYWTVRGDFRRAGTTLAPGPIDGTNVTVNVDVAAGELDWLLSAGRPVRTSAAGMGVDEATGDVTVPAGNTTPRSYTVTSVLSDSNLDAVRAAEPAPSPSPLTPPLPPRIASWAASATAGAPTGSDQLQALYRKLAESGEFQYDQAQEVNGGHGYYQIQGLLENHRGTSEQYASAYAVIARHLGFNARVVMGFRPQYKDEAFTISGRDVDAWVEVQFAKLGWVSIDPSPRAHPIGTRPDVPPPGGKGISGNDSFTDPGVSNDPPAAAPPEDGLAITDNDTSAAGRVALLTLLGIAALVTLASIAPCAKYLRRIRRRRGRSTRLAVLGAWWETIDRLREVGLRVGPTRTTGEVVQIAGEAVELKALARIIDQAAYAPDDPPPGLAHEAWDAATEAQRQLRASLRPARRIAAWIDPRPLTRPRT